MEKVTEIIRAFSEEFKAKKKNRAISNENAETGLANLERSFAKASMGVLKYQQEFTKQAV